MNLMDIKNTKLLKENEIVYPDNGPEKKVKLCLEPTSATYLYDKDDQGNFVKEGGYAECVLLNKSIYRGILDREDKNGLEIIRGVGFEPQGNENGDEFFLNVRDVVSNTETTLVIGERGDSVLLKQCFDMVDYFYAFNRNKNGDIFCASDTDGIVLFDEGKQKRFFYTFALERGEKDYAVVYQSDYPLKRKIKDGTNMQILYADEKMPYYFYTSNNEKYYCNPITGEKKLVASGKEVQELIEKVRKEAYNQLQRDGLDKYDRESKTYLKSDEQVRSKK